MKKILSFTNADPIWEHKNNVNTYVNFTYDTKTGELKFFADFGGVTKELVLGTTAAKTTGEEGGDDTGDGGEQTNP